MLGEFLTFLPQIRPAYKKRSGREWIHDFIVLIVDAPLCWMHFLQEDRKTGSDYGTSRLYS